MIIIKNDIRQINQHDGQQKDVMTAIRGDDVARIDTLPSITFLNSNFSFVETQELLKRCRSSFADEVINERRKAL